MIKKCIECGKEFETAYPFKKYCSDKCRDDNFHNRKPLAARQCLECGAEFKPIRIDQKYCSDKCRDTFNLKKRLARFREANRPIRECEYCGKEFKPTNGHQKYCSKGCYGEAQYLIVKKWRWSRD